MTDRDDIFCPVCGYYCLGGGGVGCIDKPSMTTHEDMEREGAARRKMATKNWKKSYEKRMRKLMREATRP